MRSIREFANTSVPRTPLGTDTHKPLLEAATYLIAIFAQPHGLTADGATVPRITKKRLDYFASLQCAAGGLQRPVPVHAGCESSRPAARLLRRPANRVLLSL